MKDSLTTMGEHLIRFGSVCRVKRSRRSKWSTGLVAVSAMVSGVLALGPAMANPGGAVVVNGDVRISGTPGQMTITNSDGAIIDWNSFSVGADEQLRFNQSGHASRVLNRVVGAAPSSILGTLLSNGQVYLINPNGVVVGNGAVIDTAGLVVSSLNLSNEDFANGRFSFSGGGHGDVVNHGVIKTAAGGDVLLVAPGIENHGAISTRSGNLVLAAGKSVDLASLDVAHIRFTVNADDGEIANLGKLVADAGAAGLFAANIKSHGSVEARGVSRSADGTISLVASERVAVSGRLDASGVTGGEIDITAANISVTGLDASVAGTTDGGRIRIGGDYQGKGSMPRAARVSIDQSSRINADAGVNGNGGTIVVWSDVATSTHATLTARGGAAGGNGGLVETSSAGSLDFSKPADVSAANGDGGMWLLDPEDIVIDSARADSISTALNGGSNVTVKTADEGDGEGSISVNAAITKTEGPDAALTLDAHADIDVNAPITSTDGSLDVNLVAGRKINIASTISTNGGVLRTGIVVPDGVDPDDPDIEDPLSDEGHDTDAPGDDVDGNPDESDVVQDANTDAATEVIDEVISIADVVSDPDPVSPAAGDVIITADVDTTGGDIALAADNVQITANGVPGGVSLDTGDGSLFVDASGAVTISAGGAADVQITTGGDIEIVADSLSIESYADGGDVLINSEGDFAAITVGDIEISGGNGGGDVVEINATDVSFSASTTRVSNNADQAGRTRITARNDLVIDGNDAILRGVDEEKILVSTDGRVYLDGLASGECTGCEVHIGGSRETPDFEQETRDDPNLDKDADTGVASTEAGDAGPDGVIDPDMGEGVVETLEEIADDTSNIVVALLDTTEDDDEENDQRTARRSDSDDSVRVARAGADKRPRQCH